MTTPRPKKRFYGKSYWYFALALIITGAGFYHSYFTKLRTTDIWHHLHGLAATSWMVLLIIEPLLYANGKLNWHRNLGKASFVIVPVVAISALIMTHAMMSNKANYPPGVVYQLAFLDFFYIPQFLLFYVLAIVYRRKIHLHARYMAATVFIFVLPGLVRLLFLIPAIDSFGLNLNICYVLAEIVLIILLIDDRRYGKIKLPYVLALSLFIFQHIVLNFIGNWPWWIHVMDNYAALKF